MTEQTYKKHKKILLFLIKEYKKYYDYTDDYIKKRDLTNIIAGLQYNLLELKKFNKEQLIILNKEERELIKVLNIFYGGLNQKYTKKTILNLYKS